MHSHFFRVLEMVLEMVECLVIMWELLFLRVLYCLELFVCCYEGRRRMGLPFYMGAWERMIG